MRRTLGFWLGTAAILLLTGGRASALPLSPSWGNSSGSGTTFQSLGSQSSTHTTTSQAPDLSSWLGLLNLGSQPTNTPTNTGTQTNQPLFQSSNTNTIIPNNLQFSQFGKTTAPDANSPSGTSGWTGKNDPLPVNEVPGPATLVFAGLGCGLGLTHYAIRTIRQRRQLAAQA